MDSRRFPVRRPLLSLLLIAAATLAAPACGSRQLADVPTGAQADRRLLALGQQSLEDRDWETARTWFRQLLDSYPRSQFAGDARLGIADTYNNQRGAQNALLAATEYRDYLTFFPNHPRADYAQFQIAYGHFRRRRSADRDQEDTRLATEEFRKLLDLYPNSRYAEDARRHLAECEEDLATSMLLKAEFYQDHRKWCRGAIPGSRKSSPSTPVSPNPRGSGAAREGADRLRTRERSARPLPEDRREPPGQRVRGPGA